MIYPKKLENLLECYKKLPTIGEKSAERLALATIEMSDEDIENFSKSLIEAKKDLHSNKRFGYCHTHSCGLAYSIEDAYVVTGYLKIRWTKVLHLIVEFNHNNETYILDWTRNVRMLKSDYYKMTDFEEVARFKADSVEDDMSYAGPLKLGSKVYVTFRDEIISDLEKNKTLFRK